MKTLTTHTHSVTQCDSVVYYLWQDREGEVNERLEELSHSSRAAAQSKCADLI